MQLSAVNSYPYALGLYNDSNGRMLTLNRSVFMNENKHTNRSSIVLFRCSEFAKEFRDEVVTGSNLCYNTWSLSCDDVSSSEKKYKRAIFHTKKEDRLTDFYEDSIIIPTPIENYDSIDFIDKLLTYNISTFFMDTYEVFQSNGNVNLYGHLWTPPQDVIYYTSDVEKLFDT